jgi:hypothetical protein
MGKMQRIGFSQVTSSVALWFRGSFRRFSGKGGGETTNPWREGEAEGERGGPRGGREGQGWQGWGAMAFQLHDMTLECLFFLLFLLLSLYLQYPPLIISIVAFISFASPSLLRLNPIQDNAYHHNKQQQS